MSDSIRLSGLAVRKVGAHYLSEDRILESGIQPIVCLASLLESFGKRYTLIIGVNRAIFPGVRPMIPTIFWFLK